MSDGNTEEQSSQKPQKGIEALKIHVIENKIDCSLWLLRVFTLMFCFGYVLPIFNNATNAYYKALLCNAAISALRLHQRLPRPSFTKEFLSELLMEDSCHYLFYTMIFLYVAPVFLVIIPVGLFALLHAASYGLTLLDTLGQNSWWGARLTISLVEFQSRNILRVVSLAEIMLMPCVVFMIFFGRAGLFTPFVYYRFLCFRYVSRRNPYTRNMFRELRNWAETNAAKPGLPGFVKKALLTSVDFTCRLAPPMPVAQE